MRSKLICLLLLSCTTISAQITRFEKSKGTESPTYHEGIAWWKEFAAENKNVTITEFGETDAGYPLHLVCMGEAPFEVDAIKRSDKLVLLINNAIHPGEPDGVDASMLLFRDLKEKWQMTEHLKECIVMCIPYYNIGGALNRNSYSRTNQEGPIEYGFRGNAQNLDLNRDFVKCDSKNALNFARLLQRVDPDVYVETHVSNGADYQYTMTYLATQPDKLGYGMGNYLRNEVLPALEHSMFNKDEEMSPYVNIHGGPLKDKIHTFYDSPRYSTGLTTLHQSFGFITETHMLKKFRERVWATHKFLKSTLEFCSKHSLEMRLLRSRAKDKVKKANLFPIDWVVDTNSYVEQKFNAYQYDYKKSEVTGQERLFYDRSKPITKKIKHYNRMSASKTQKSPKYYILKKGFGQVEKRLQANGVPMIALERDTVILVKAYQIRSYETTKRPYEKHYYHYDTKYDLKSMLYQFRKGDYLIPMNTDKNRFITEVFEPDAPDSYFNWNFFDAVLQQKEWYSAYVFEDKAAQMLRTNRKLKKAFLEKKKSDANFAKNTQAQLYWIYKRSPHYEKEHMRLPIFRIE